MKNRQSDEPDITPETTTAEEEEEKVEEEEKEEEDTDDQENESKGPGKSKKCAGFPWDNDRLPRSISPDVYNLTIHPNLTSAHLHGKLEIYLTALNSTKFIVLHAVDLKHISSALKQNGERVDADFVECKELEQWAWKARKAVEEGDRIELTIEYEGLVSSDLQGLYINTHSDKNLKQTRSAVTQFEPTFARKMFPCFDEPNFKAEFEVAVVRDPGHVVRSNMNIKVSREYEEGLIVDVFKRSVKMSTYLLAVAVLDGFDYVKRTTRNTAETVEVRLYAPKDVIKGQSSFGLDTAIRALEFFEKYFNISYPLEKIDLLALDDFSEGAMENWGLVTFRDSALLHDELKSSVLAKEHIALIICHEIAHQWFGNLVTMDWWNDVWLNEGFANYMEYRCVDELYPQWNIMTRFYAENVVFSQETDGLSSSRAIESSDESNLLNLFDAISYHKAAAIIHMIAELAGQRNFQRALIEYLNKYKYGNARGSQLWNIVEKHAKLAHSGVSIQTLSKAYISQMGYPVIHVGLDGNDKAVVHNQTRLLFTESTDKNDESWPIPIHYRTSSDDEIKLHWLRHNDKDGESSEIIQSIANLVTWELPAPSSWLIANTGGVGYFKVRYEDEIYEALTRQLQDNHSAISSIDRSMILVDAFDLARTEQLNIQVYLDLVEYAQKEEDRMAWMLINKQLRTIESLIEETEFVNLFKDFERTLVLGIYERSGWKDTKKNPADKGLQMEVLQMACRLRSRDCIKQALTRYNKWMNDGQRPPAEVHGIVLEEGVRQGGPSAWDKAWTAYEAGASPTERNQLLGALAATQDPALLNKLLRFCLDGKIKPNIIPRVFSAISHNEAGRSLAWRFFKMNYDKFKKILGDRSTLMTSCIRYLGEPLSTREDLQELKDFLKEKLGSGKETKLDQVFEQVELNIQWRRLNEEALQEWLKSWDDRRRQLNRRRRRVHTRAHRN
ncbi:unnamed protein product [Caenorhabditis auriculariae]|uniref:Aminopeptidase n=1 Tax=Caenorhabditis auriculariae TaxID=2777116 RepID=A0A8S1HKA9_9PELO|nr:unnamed protein product [Caenorhabditis auriculariae]